MNKVEIIALAKVITRQADLDEDMLAIYYNEALEEISRAPNPPLVSAELFAITSGTAAYPYIDDALRLLAVFSDDKQLMPASITDLEAYDDGFRALTGFPFAFTEGEVSKRTFTLVPSPTTTSDPIIPLAGEPFGEDFPDNIGTQLFAVTREAAIPDWLSLFIVFHMLANEYDRPSEHQDVTFAKHCRQMSELLWKAAGL